MSKIPLSVLVVFKHGDDIFFINRQNHLRVFPGYCSFPGGKANKRDRADFAPEIEPKILGAAQREIQEELNIDLEKANAKGLVKGIRLIGEATTPDFNPYRFNAQYLLVELWEKLDFEHNRNEIKEGFWANPAQLKKRFENGELLVIPPMWNILNYLERGKTTPENFNKKFLKGEVPWLETIYGVKQFMPLSNTLPPAERTNAFVIGDTLVDPSPKDKAELEKLLHSLANEKINKIFITHHHGDHHHLALDVASAFGAEILASSYTFGRIKEIKGEDYFTKHTLKPVSEGDVVTSWLREEVKVHEVPGHDEGQLALAPSGLGWFIAGDLFQGIGTVVIGGREGNMKKYFATLEKVISLGPKAVYPSHGIALGGVEILNKTLKHRMHREEQIKKMFREGLTPNQMLERIYFDLPKPLHKYALANIDSHLRKLKEEGKV